jgi:GDPmannose 4,6-dehydratase
MGDASKAREQLGWAPKVDFQGLVRRMYESDLADESTKAEAGR